MLALLDLIVRIYSLGLLIFVFLGWFNSPQTAAARRWLSRYYEPVLIRIRQHVKPLQMGAGLVDISPAIFLIGLVMLQRIVAGMAPRGLR